MNKLSHTLSLFLFVTLSGFAQLNSHYHEMVCYVDYKDFDNALKEVELMRTDGTTLEHARQSYKSYLLLKKDESAKSTANRDSAFYYAVSSKKKLLNYVAEATKNCDGTLRSISAKHYASVVKLADGKPDSALYYYSRYREVAVYTEDSAALKKKDVEVYSAIAVRYMNNHSSDTSSHKSDLEKGINLYKKVLEIDSNYINANLNVMIAYYNVGVQTIRKADVCKQQQLIGSVDWNKSQIPSLEKLLECIKPEEYEKYHIPPPFRAALPYALKVYRLDPSNKICLEALSGIYLALSDKKNYKKYKQKRDSLNTTKTS